MVQVKELRIVLPLTIEDYELGSEYTAARAAYEASKGAEGDDAIEISKVEDYFDEELQRTGTYTQRIYHIGKEASVAILEIPTLITDCFDDFLHKVDCSYLPAWITALLPKSAVTFYEDCYVCYPKIETNVFNEWLGERLEFRIQTRIAEGKGDSENVLKLSEEQMKHRKIQTVDITEYKSKDLDPKLHPTNVTLEKIKPSPLCKGWINSAENLVCAYKTVTAKVQVWGLQGKLESWIIGFEEDLLTNIHVKMYAWADEWKGLSKDEVDEYTLKNKAEMKALAEIKRGKSTTSGDAKSKKEKKK